MSGIAFKHLVAASAHFHRLVRVHVVTDDGLAHAQTQILAAARLAGLLMFRSFRVDTGSLPPGMRVASSEALIHGRRLREVLLATLHQLGHRVAMEDLDERSRAGEISRLSFVEVHERLTPRALSYLELSPMGMRDAATAAATAAAGLIHDHAPAVCVRQAAALACGGFEEGVTTVPWPFAYDLDAARRLLASLRLNPA